MDLTHILFIILSIVAIASAIVMISARHPVVSAVSLVVHFLMLSGLYLTLNAQFIAVLQILVYAGAIMVLVIFVIMLLNLSDEVKMKEGFDLRKGVALSLGAAFIVQMFIFIGTGRELTNQMPDVSVENGTVEALGMDLFTNYIFHFEYIALVLLVAVVGAILLGKKKVFLERDN